MNRQSFIPNNVQRLSIDVTLPSDTVFSVPTAGIISELPDDVDKREFIKAKASSGDRREYYIPQSTLLFRLDDIPYPKPIRNQNTTLASSVNKKGKDITALKREREALREELKRNEDRIAFLEEDNKKLQKGISNWRNLYQSIRSTKDDNDQEAFYQYEERIRIERYKDDIINDMERQVIRLRSDIEEVKITEDEIVAEWNYLVSGIKDCTGMMSYYLSKSEWWIQVDDSLKSSLKFDHPVFKQLSIVEYFLPAELCRLVLSAAEKHLYSTLTQWSDLERNEPGVLGSGLSRFEIEMYRLLNASLTNHNPPAANLGMHEDPILLEKAFYRWRSDTIRLLSYITKRTSHGNTNEMAVNTSQTICTQLLATLPISMLPMKSEATRKPVGSSNPEQDYQGHVHQVNQQTPSRAHYNGNIDSGVGGLQSDIQQTAEGLDNEEPYMEQLAEMLESLGMNEDLDDAIDGLVKKVSECVNQALLLYTRVRCCRPNYEFQWAEKGEKFNPKKMIIFPEQNNEYANQTDPNHRVLFCTYPGIFKYGDDDGNNYKNPRLVAPIQVIIDDQIFRTMQPQVPPPQPAYVPQGSAPPTTGRRRRLNRSGTPGQLQPLQPPQPPPSEMNGNNDPAAQPKSIAGTVLSKLSLW